ncbi:hypothetical protein CON36_28340 [Bacillus cereus]|uniref:Uncharacterized protein n=1 Tax=Bacillus cereus TaxID=1396 RepID=A0A9X6XW28_BACCE|nr:hypothetical protein [Bacillus cereus]PDZ95462.1 hypothetical protein CON36_28340 [Bacillus cereus]
MNIETQIKDFELCIQPRIDVINRHEVWINDNPENIEGIQHRRQLIKDEEENIEQFMKLHILYHAMLLERR